jgi:large subunit ribosomal protein L19
MALTAKHKKNTFGVGDVVKVTLKVEEDGKIRTRVFEGIVIKIKGSHENKTFTVRRIGVQQIGIERIFPLEAPFIESVEVVRHGLRGTRRAKLYYIRDKSKREIEKIYSRAKKREKTSKKTPKAK